MRCIDPTPAGSGIVYHRSGRADVAYHRFFANKESVHGKGSPEKDRFKDVHRPGIAGAGSRADRHHLAVRPRP